MTVFDICGSVVATKSGEVNGIMQTGSFPSLRINYNKNYGGMANLKIANIQFYKY